jgi:hypothetical protein
MVKRLLHALLVFQLLWSAVAPAIAGNLRPLDEPVTSGPTTATYAAGTTLNLQGHGTATVPDTPPFYSVMPANIATPNPLNWTSVGNGTSSYVTCSSPLTVSCEAKYRFTINCNHALYDDLLRNAREPGTSHGHEYCGNAEANAFSTYQTLRTRSESYTTGGRTFSTAYWFPGWLLTNPNGDGKNYFNRTNVISGYYKGDSSNSGWLVVPPPGLDLVFGINPDDPQDTIPKREIIVANAQAGTAGRYGFPVNGFVGYECDVYPDSATTYTGGDPVALTGAQTANGQIYQPFLNSTDGQNHTDPWLGNCKDNAHGLHAVILEEIQGQDCWNGIDGWVPGATGHVRYSVSDTQLNAGRIQRACPNNWYHHPQLELKRQHLVYGYADYDRVRLTSDDMMEAKLNSLPTCTSDAIGAYANAPCAERVLPYWNSTLGRFKVANGASDHGDWKMAVDGWVWKQIMARCMGIGGLYDGDGTITSTAGSLIPSVAHTCEPGVIIPNGTSTTFLLNSGASPPAVDPQGPTHTPITNLYQFYDTLSASRMFRVRTVNPSGTGSGRMCMNTMPC